MRDRLLRDRLRHRLSQALCAPPLLGLCSAFACRRGLFFLVVQHAVAKPFKVGIFHLISELCADAFRIGRALKAAGAVSVVFRKAFTNDTHYFLVRIFVYAHELFLSLLSLLIPSLIPNLGI